MPVRPWLCDGLGPGCRMRHKVLSALSFVIVICRLIAAALGRRVRSLLHLDGNRGLWDPIFFHATPGATMNPPSTWLTATSGR